MNRTLLRTLKIETVKEKHDTYVELKYPSQRNKLIMTGGNGHSSAQIGKSTAITKNGIQQTTKAPVMIASVLAAFRSLLELVSFAEGVFFFSIDGLDLLRSLLKFGGCCGFFQEAGIG